MQVELAARVETRVHRGALMCVMLRDWPLWLVLVLLLRLWQLGVPNAW